jgi:hypothetical protein
MRPFSRSVAAMVMCVWLGACTHEGPANAPQPEVASEWKPLFNGKNLDGFTVFLDRSGKNNDEKGIFKVENGMLHIMDLPESTATQETGYLATNKTYGDFHLRLQYKWGTKRWAPRATLARDSGIHYFLTAEDKVWGNALECQIEEGVTGDLYNLNGYYALEAKVVDPMPRQKTFSATGTLTALTGNRLIRGETVDSLTDWNTVEVIVKGNSSTHIVNGRTVMQVENVTRLGQPVREGRIAFQAEAAEMWYRNVEIRMLK